MVEYAVLDETARPPVTVGEQQARMGIASFKSRRRESGGARLRVHWAGPCPYCEGPNYQEMIQGSGGAWRIEGWCNDCGTRRQAYRPLST
jgi:hypothetical protein